MVWKRMMKASPKKSMPKAEPYYDIKSKTTKYSTKGNVKNLEMPKKAKRK